MNSLSKRLRGVTITNSTIQYCLLNKRERKKGSQESTLRKRSSNIPHYYVSGTLFAVFNMKYMYLVCDRLIRTHNSNKSVNYTTKRSPRKWGRRQTVVPACQLSMTTYHCLFPQFHCQPLHYRYRHLSPVDPCYQL